MRGHHFGHPYVNRSLNEEKRKKVARKKIKGKKSERNKNNQNEMIFSRVTHVVIMGRFMKTGR